MPGAIYKSNDKADDKPKNRPSLLNKLTSPAKPQPEAEPERRRPPKQDDGKLSLPKPERAESGRVWQVRLTPSLITMLSIVVVVSLCFFFLFGVIVGRGYAPVAQSAEPEKLLPDTSSQELAEAPEQVLPPEQLRFMSNLRDQTTPLPLPEAAQATVPSVTQPRNNPAVTQPTASQQVTQPQAAPTQQASAEVRDYVLQAAAFKVESQADALREKLEGVGVRTKLVKEKAEKGTWYKVQVLFRGTPQKLEELRHTLSGKGVKDALVISQKVVS